MTLPIPPLLALHTDLVHLTRHQLVFEGESTRERVLTALAKLDPMDALRRIGRGATSLAEEALATGDPEIVDALAARLEQLPADMRAEHACLPPLRRTHPSDARAMLQAWRRLFPHTPHISQSEWFKLAHTAATLHQGDTLAWVLAQPDYWTDRPDRMLDGLDHLVRHALDAGARNLVVAQLPAIWARLDAHPDTPDMRLRHSPALWAIGCARSGWLTPTHSRRAVFEAIANASHSAHTTLALHQRLGRWEDWVGLGEAKTEARLLAMVAPHTGA